LPYAWCLLPVRCYLFLVACSPVPNAREKRLDQRGLANPRLTRDEDDLALAD